jgi:outer membrane protein assembly factor BamB
MIRTRQFADILYLGVGLLLVTFMLCASCGGATLGDGPALGKSTMKKPEKPPPDPAVNVQLGTDKSTYIIGEDTTAVLTAVVTDEYGDPISGLDLVYPSAFATALDGGPEDAGVDFTESATAGTYTGNLDISGLSASDHTVQTTVTDTRAVSGSDSATFAMYEPGAGGTMHVGDLDGSIDYGPHDWWHGVFTVKIGDSSHNPVSGADVSFSLSGTESGSGQVTTGSDGTASYQTGWIKSSGYLTFTVDDVTHATLSYSPADNHDPDGDSDGTSITIPVAPWPTFRYNNLHTGRSPYVGAQTNNVKWSYDTGSQLARSSPAIGADGTVYVGSSVNRFSTIIKKLYAINPDGSLKWSYTTGGAVWSSPAIGADGTVYVGCHDTKLYAINPDGSLKWAYQTEDRVDRSSPAIGAVGTVYVGSNDNKLYAINPDGSLKWSYTTGGTVNSSPAIGADGTVYVGSADFNLYAINPDGSLKWSYTTGDTVGSSPAIGVDGTVYVGSQDNNLYAINPDGSLKWSYTAGGTVISSPAIGADGTVYVGSADNNLYAINSNGSLNWSYPTGGLVRSSPAIGADGTVYVGSGNGGDVYAINKVYAINPDGSLKWSHTTGGDVRSSPAIAADGTVYVGCDDYKLYAFGPSS